MIHPRQIVVTLLLLAAAARAQDWPDGKELSGRLLDLARLDRATVHDLGRSAGGQKLRLLEVAPLGPGDSGGPAILVLANLEGDLPLASLTAVELAAEVLAAPADQPAARVRWYILPLANPDGLDRWFERPRAADGRNRTPFDDDADGLEGEDPPDDLDGDGLITWMLVEDPAGSWRLTDAGLPVAADPARGHPGLYRREIEGRDQDGDGRFNEDPPGGVDVAHNFPHGFKPWRQAGRWPADQPESRAILEFAFGHPDVALVLVLGRDNNLLVLPEPQPDLAPGKLVKPNWRLAHDLGLDAEAEYTLQSVLDAARDRGLSPATVRARLSLEPIGKPLTEDLRWWGALVDRYAGYLREHGLDAPREAPAAPGDGSAAAWAYFQFGTPAVALDLWSLPAPPDTAGADTSAAAATVDPGPEPDPVHVRLQRRTEQNRHAGWRAWTRVTLPDGTAALVGGPEPGAVDTPAAYAAQERSRAFLPFCLELAGWLPRLELAPLQLADRGAGLTEVTAVVRNPGPLPYPTAMGQVNQRPGPVVVTLDGGEPLQCDLRRTVPGVPAGGAVTLRWLVRTGRPERLAVTATAPGLGTVTVTGGAR
ncbi:MAG: M14 family zinc carboxypeptidase [Candidatus Krumholzibacteriia bacterium]